MIPARSCSMSRAELDEGSVDVPPASDGEPLGDGEPDGMVWATVRKNSSMYWSDCGSYYDIMLDSVYTTGLKHGFGNIRRQGRRLLRGRCSCVRLVGGHLGRGRGERILVE